MIASSSVQRRPWPRGAFPFRRILAVLLLSLAVQAPAAAATAEPDPLWGSFVAPPADARPMMRWWWFGPSVTREELTRELEAMKRGGIGGVEVQPVYPLVPEGAPGAVNAPYLSDPFLALLRHAALEARRNGLRFDVTLGSGWPFGGPHVPIDHASAEIRMKRITAPAGAGEVILPALGPGESLVDVRIGPPGGDASADTWTRLAWSGPRLTLEPSVLPREILVFIAGRTGQQVKRAAVGGEGYVIDHLDRDAVDRHLAQVGDRLLEAFRDGPPPDAVFSDSLEAYGASWTGDFAAEFRRRRGYDLIPHLPALFLDTNGHGEIRYDWARTLSELVEERYLAAVNGWARERGVRFRAQVYGFPAPTLSSGALVDLPEGEGEEWRGFTSTRWATSSAHLYGKPIVSSEVWTWLHSPAWAATPLDLKVEADRHFLQGVNQLVGHGWPYSPPEAAAPGWSFYAAGALNDQNPWYGVMPEVSLYLQRVSHLLRQGAPANDVAIYLPIEDAFASMTPAKTSANEAMPSRVGKDLVGQVLDAGHGFDFVDAAAVASGKLTHRALVLPAMTRMDARALAAVEAWTQRGGRLVVVESMPSTSGGLLDDADRTQVAALARRLSASRAVQIVGRNGIAAALARAAPPALVLDRPNPALGFVRRRLLDQDLYFLVNTSNRPLSAQARFDTRFKAAQWWDPVSGRRRTVPGRRIEINLAPYESAFLVFSRTAQPIARDHPPTATRPLADGWSLALAGGPARPLARPMFWTDEPDLAGFSGVGVYRSAIRIEPTLDGRCLTLDFGAGVPVTPPPGARPQAAIEGPVREGAVISLNGARIGAVWAPPYRIELGEALSPGNYEIEVSVGNTNQNLLAGRSPPDFRLLNARYGERFRAQDLDRLSAQPSGMGRAPTLEVRRCLDHAPSD